MKNINKYLAALCVLGLASFGSVAAQDITIQSTGKLRVFSTGVLKLNKNAGKFRTSGSGASVVNQGKIQFNGTDNTFTSRPTDGCDDTDDDPALALGNSASNRVPGLVEYGKGSSSQNVQVRYYEDLAMAGVSTKSIPDGVYVSGEYSPAGGNRTYVGTFHYDGTDSQTIAPEQNGVGGSGYNNVELSGDGVKTLADGTIADMANLVITSTQIGDVVINGTVNASGNVTQDAANKLDIAGGIVNVAGTGSSVFGGAITIGGTSGDPGSLNQSGIGDMALNGTVTVGEQGSFNVTEGTATIGSGGSLALGDFVDAKISVADGKTLTVTGSMTNSHAAGDNTAFADNSTVVYNGAADQVVMATTENNPYGNLNIEGVGSKKATGLVALSGNFTLKDADFTMDCGTPGEFIWMTDPTATVTYGDGTALSNAFEVIGGFRRSTNGTNGPLTYNNYATTVDLSTATDVNWIQLCVTPGATAFTGYDQNNTVKRTIKYSYDVDSPSNTNWAAAVSYGYKKSELESGQQTEAFQKSLRFRETDGSSLDEKVATTATYGRNVTGTDPFHSIVLGSIRETGRAVAPQTALAEVADGNLLFLRGGPAEFISVKSGRWSNPATWDEGEQPGPEDIALIRTNVHIGFQRTGGDNFNTDEDVHIATFDGYTNKTTIAAKIVVNDKEQDPTLGSDVATLVVGGTAPVGLTKDIALVTDSGQLFVNDSKSNNAVAYADKDAFDANGAFGDFTATSADRNAGLVVLGGATLTAEKICVKGAVNNAGEINVSEED